jgi:hypothetical protein
VSSRAQTPPRRRRSRRRPERRPHARTIIALLAITAMTIVAMAAASPARDGSLWISQAEIDTLPASGAGWEAVKAAADESLSGSDANLATRNDHNTGTLAAALVGARLDDDAYRAKARDALADVVSQEPHRDDVLAAARKLGTYVIAADVMDLSTFDPDFDQRFRTWVRSMLTFEYSGGGGGGSIVSVHERRPNNFGTHAGASRIAAAVYLGDQAELDRAATVFRGWLGDRQAYADFDFGDLAWQARPDHPVGVNPAGTSRDGHSIDGVLPDDQRRAGGFTWPPPKENYVWEALQGATVQAELLTRQGYDAWGWQDAALLRAVRWLHEQAEFPAEGDDLWVPWLLNHAYGTSFPAGHSTGKNMGFTGWTHAERGEPVVEVTPEEPVDDVTEAASEEPTETESEAAAAEEETEPADSSEPSGAGDTTHLASGRSSGTDRVTSDAVAPRDGALHLVVVSAKPDAGVQAVEGLGVDWRPVAEQCSGRGQTSIAVWVGHGEAQRGHVGVELDRAVAHATVAVLAVDDVSAVEGFGANTNGIGGACKHGNDSAAYGLGSASGPVLVAATTRTARHEAGPGLTEIVELRSGKGGGAAGLALAGASSPTTVQGTFSSEIDWAAVTVHLR